MATNYYPPKFKHDEFHCPFCQVYSAHYWQQTQYFMGSLTAVPGLFTALCLHCKKLSVWYNSVMLFPETSSAPIPHEDLPQAIISDYNEARSIVTKSPRGAAALLRLALQKLMIEIGESGKDINRDIASLVKNGLPVQVQQALDILRVVGNESVHPGEMDIRDDVETATQLFELINFIVEDRITKPKQVSALFGKLPQDKRDHIETRDRTK